MPENSRSFSLGWAVKGTVMDRRELLIGIGASAVLSKRVIAAAVAASDQLFADTPFANNRVARSFERVDLRLPNARVTSGSGPMRLGHVAGGPILLTLWSEWCVPCLVEARDLAAARSRVVGNGFNIISLLTGSVAKLDHAAAAARLVKAGAPGLTLFVEPNGDHVVADALAADPLPVPAGRSTPPPTGQIAKAGGYSLPCTVLVDRRGHVRGRAFGISVMRNVPRSPLTAPAGVPRPLSDAEKQAMMGGSTQTAWASPDGEAFLLALRGGLLDRV